VACVIGTGQESRFSAVFPFRSRTLRIDVCVLAYAGDRVLVLLRDRARQVHSDARVRRLSFFDPLTGLPNRQSFLIDMSERLARVDVDPFAILHVDLDEFREINDANGPSVGDGVLAAVAARLEACRRDADSVHRASKSCRTAVARLGGDEFILMLDGFADAAAAETAARRVVDAFESPVVYRGQSFSTTPSVGVALYPDDGRDVDTLMKNAEAAMHRAKAAGRNRALRYRATTAADSSRRTTIERDLRRAIENDELALHFQPVLNLAPRYVSGVEALLRWTHPSLGELPPADFVRVAEQRGLGQVLGEWVIDAACRQQKYWQADGLDELTVAINLSARQFAYKTVARDLLSALSSHDVEPCRFAIELKEGVLSDGADESERQIRRLRDAGVRVMIDNFGAGASPLVSLTHYPLDAVKIDRSLVAGIDAEDSRYRSICASVIALSHSLGLVVVAEGVETERQRQYLHFLDCDRIQGFHFARPMPSDELLDFVAEHRRRYPRKDTGVYPLAL
jgi:diguanylate cyclase (GGDEF)-like protein